MTAPNLETKCHKGIDVIKLVRKKSGWRWDKKVWQMC